MILDPRAPARRTTARGAARPRHARADRFVTPLHELVARLVGESPWVLSAGRSPSRYRSTHILEEVDVELDDGRVVRLLLKAYGASTLEGEPLARPWFVSDPFRELWAYEHVLDPVRHDVPRLLGTIDGGGRGGERIVLERMEGRELYQVGEFEAWLAAARWLARFHGEGRSMVESLRDSGHLLEQDARLHGRWLGRAIHFARARGRPWDAAALEGLGGIVDDAVQTLARVPRTVIHGEFYASNVLVSGAPKGWRVRPVDWEGIAAGPGVLDLAALVAGWEDRKKEEITDAYRRTCDPRPAGGPAGFRRELLCARLIGAVQWLGWAESWTPPREHAQDWLAEASHVAGLLEA